MESVFPRLTSPRRDLYSGRVYEILLFSAPRDYLAFLALLAAISIIARTQQNFLFKIELSAALAAAFFEASVRIRAPTDGAIEDAARAAARMRGYAAHAWAQFMNPTAIEGALLTLYQGGGLIASVLLAKYVPGRAFVSAALGALALSPVLVRLRRDRETQEEVKLRTRALLAALRGYLPERAAATATAPVPIMWDGSDEH
eukprot:gnl/Chilomastix_cuspidata/5873.p1 GENE.gnl/Chilomastix_cuspidata/5873~~gnl/Chilomastix_cuspidata/5873.p1  ORF type:complete len:201 (+),score=82.38 gnl/Chilomastix_cuspidata/5873:461-1063(+)